MYWVVIRSVVTRAYIDLPCLLDCSSEPISSKARVAPEYRLSEAQLRSFARDGFLGPFDALTEREAARLADEMASKRAVPSRNFGIVTDRDLHLETPSMLNAMRNPVILETAAQLLGPDLLAWRSQLFFKSPGGKAVEWHQASTYLVENYLAPLLEPSNRNELFELTAWIALGPTTQENGCMQFVPGTHDRIRTVRFGGESGFYKVSYGLEFDLDPSKVVTVEMKPGQVVLFSERVIHGSRPNRTEQMRFAMAFRMVRPDVRIYPDQTSYRAMHMGQAYSLENWGAILMRGVDRFGLNKRIRSSAAVGSC